MEVAALPTPVLTEMPPVNFLKATKISLFDPMLIYLFRNHFSTWIDANNYGSQADFVELYAAFREVYKNHSKVDTSLDASREGKTLDFQALQALDDQNDLLLDVSFPSTPCVLLTSSRALFLILLAILGVCYGHGPARRLF